MKIKIKNSRLELERVNSLLDLPGVVGRKDLRYKTLYAINPSSVALVGRVPCMSCSFRDLIADPSSKSIMEMFGEYYIITTSGIKDSKIVYTQSEKKILVSVFSGLSDEHRLDTAEIFCHAIGNRELLDMFYSDYGKMDDTRLLCQKLCEAPSIPSIADTSKLYPHQYQRPRYSIYELLQDLIQAKAYICTDPDLTGKYEKISRNLKKTSETVGDNWNPVVGQSFNKTRANLNLNYMALVKVEVPANSHGVDPGERELKTLRSICLVKDGKVCNTSFGVRIEDRDLRKKLKAAGIVKSELVYAGDFLLDISNLPVVSKSKVSCIRSFDLGTAETWYRLSDIALEYLKRREYKEKKKLDKIPEKIDFTDNSMSEAELYLASLGIYGEYFYPDKKVGAVKKVYDATELVGNLKSLPTKETCTKNITKLLNGSPKVNPFVADFLGTYVIPEVDKGIPYKTLIETWERKKNYYWSIIRDLKFRLISGKSLNVCVHGSRRKSILNTTQIIKVGTHKISVTWGLKEKHVIV